MTTEQDVARNAAAVRNLAAVLERWGLALVGTSSTAEGREAAKRLFEETLRARGAR